MTIMACHVERPWADIEKPLALILSNLPRLTSLKLVVVPSFVDWRQLSPELKNALSRVLQLPTLTCVDLRGFLNIPLSPVFLAPAVNHLALTSGSLSANEDRNLPPNLPFAPLRSQLVSLTALETAVNPYHWDILTSPHSPFDLAHLRKLSYRSRAIFDGHNTYRSHDALWKLLQACAGSLCELRYFFDIELEGLLRSLPRSRFVAQTLFVALDRMDSIVKTLEPINLGHLQNLKSLELNIGICASRQYRIPVPDPLPAFTQILETLRPNSSLESLTATLVVNSVDYWAEDGWERLDHLLNGPRATHLRNFELKLLVSEDRRQTLESPKCHAFLLQKLPLLRKRGIVKVALVEREEFV